MGSFRPDFLCTDDILNRLKIIKILKHHLMDLENHRTAICAAAEAACAVEDTAAEDTAAIFRIKVEEESRRRGSFLDEGTGGEAIDESDHWDYDENSDHKFFESEESYQDKQETLKQPLNGIWKFQYSVNAKKRPVSFYENDYDISEFDEIQVPQHIELAGYDKIH